MNHKQHHKISRVIIRTKTIHIAQQYPKNAKQVLGRELLERKDQTRA